MVLEKFKGCAHFRQRLVLATLVGKAIKIDDIRSNDEHPGLRDFEASFLRLLDKMTNGAKIEINVTGTSVTYKPGVIIGGKISHECPPSRGMGYFLEGLAHLAPFGKKALSAKLTGVTNESQDISVDLFRTVTVKLMEHFGLDEGLGLKIVKRGAPPNGGGEVLFYCPIVKQLKAVQFMDVGKMKRIRGVAYSTRVSPQIANRIVDAARGPLNKLLPDVYIYTDHYKGPESGLSPGFALSLVAESTSGVLISAEVTGGAGILPEDLGKQAAKQICQEISYGGCIDNYHQSLICVLMALTPEDVSKIRVGRLNEFTIGTLRLLRDLLGITFKITTDVEDNSAVLTCVGIGYRNMNREAI
eukprot:GCRY01004570.1.p1 GENE.GCRY01004570.1~~GCRY01004570.1.p1  ORF type:complete len:358 (+),score=52.89 GCRY01004570.1:168-1241(+)